MADSKWLLAVPVVGGIAAAAWFLLKPKAVGGAQGAGRPRAVPAGAAPPGAKVDTATAYMNVIARARAELGSSGSILTPPQIIAKMRVLKDEANNAEANGSITLMDREGIVSDADTLIAQATARLAMLTATGIMR